MRTPKPTVVYIVAEKAPANVFFKVDIAQQAAADQSTGGLTMSVFTRTVTSESSFRKDERTKALARLSPEEKARLGLIKKPRRKKSTVDATTAAANVAA